MLETNLCNQPWWPSWIIVGFKRRNFGREHPRTIWTKLNLVSFHPVVLNTIFKDFQFFYKSESMAAILDLGQGHRTQFWKKIKTTQRVSHQAKKKIPVFPLASSKILGSVGRKKIFYFFILTNFYRGHILTLIVLVQQWQKKNFRGGTKNQGRQGQRKHMFFFIFGLNVWPNLAKLKRTKCEKTLDDK